MNKNKKGTLESTRSTKKQRAEASKEDKLAPWTALPTLPLYKIFEAVSAVDPQNVFPENPLSHVGAFALTCKAFHQIYANSFLSLHADVVKLFARKHESAGISTLAKRSVLDKMKEFIFKQEGVLNSAEKLVEKKEEWHKFLSDKNMDKKAASLLSSHIFDLVSYRNVHVENMENRYRYEATICIGPLGMEHYAYDEGGCNTSWALTLTRQEDDYYICKLREVSSEITYFSPVLTIVRETLDLTDSQLIPDDLLIKALVYTIPWKFGNSCCYYSKAVSA